MTTEIASKYAVGLIAENENQILAHVSRGLCLFLETCGYKTDLIDLMKPDGLTKLEDSLQKRPTFVFSYAGICASLQNTKEESLWEARKIPFVSLWFDHPAYNYRQHQADTSYVLNVYHVRDHLEVREKYLPCRNRTLLLSQTLGRRIFKNPRPNEQRIDEILFLKTGDEPARYEKEWRTYPEKLKTLLFDLADLAIKNRNINLTAAAAQLFEAASASRENPDLFFGVVQDVDRYVRAWRSDKMARALLKHPAVFIGRGWDYLDTARSPAKVLPPSEGKDSIRLLSEYRLCANVNPLWRDGYHERIGYGILSGAIVLTDKTEKADRLFQDMPHYRGFEWEDDLEDVIREGFVLMGKDEDYRSLGEKKVSETLLATYENMIEKIEKAIAPKERA